MESPWFLDNLIFFILRPLLATSFIVCFIALWWFLAWKLVLSHVPLVQEIFGLRHKTFIPKPESRGRISKFYKSITSSQNHGNNYYLPFTLYLFNTTTTEAITVFFGL
ncbi:uncharacterized protein LOC125608562 [Brassica napus]|uniref:uncharacterized protein LOC125608562 n=2 Tax=Brassica TaxID=3705 RepID=UPI0020786635|nr:uncharacterized protein LOC125608562 [Brassica napus]